MKPIVSILGDSVAAAALLIAGFGLHSFLGAPSWSMVLFALPFMIFANYRLGGSLRYPVFFVVLFSVLTWASAYLLPTEYRNFTGVLIVIFLARLVGSSDRSKAQTKSNQVD